MSLKLTRRHGSPCWYVRGSVRGIRVDESTGVGDRKAAEDILIKRGAEILQRSIHGDSATRTFAEAALSYMGAGGEAEHLAPLLKHFGQRRKLCNIGQAEIDEAAEKLYPRCAPATLNRKVYTPVSAVLHHAARKKWCPKPVVARPRMPAPRVRWITYEEAERLIEAASEHLRPLVIFLLGTGARVSEALYLERRFLDLPRAHVTFVDTKNSESRGVPLHPRVVAALASMPRRNSAEVFLRPDGMPYERRSEGGGMLKTAWGGMCRRAGIADFTPHDCRHTWATWHYAANRDIPALMELGGWKSVEMVMRYAHINVGHLAPSIGRLWGNYGELHSAASESTARTVA